MRIYQILSLTAATSLLPLTVQAGATKPNIVVILADDLGYGDLGCYGAKYATPVIDKMAAEGFRATDFFVPANVCSPSRAALLTGRYPMRNGHPFYLNESSNFGLDPEELTIPELLKPAGYRTLAIGKWHLGLEFDGSHPLDVGFDKFLGLRSNYGTKKSKKNPDGNSDTLFRGREVETEKVKFQTLTTSFTDEVVDFISDESDQPFFIYMAHVIAHTPILPSKQFKGVSKQGVYGDYVSELDHSVGRVLKAIKDAGQEENTLVVFLADNGATPSGSNAALSGGKYNTMEGGHRVPGIFRWPGHIPAGQVSDTTISSMDLLPLFCDLAGVEVPSDRKLDGSNIIGILKGETKESPHEILYYYNGLNLQAVRKGKWKLHLPRTEKDQPYWANAKSGRRFITLEEPFLVDLYSDIGEDKNVASQNPEVVAMLLKEADRIRFELGDVGKTGSDQRLGWPPVE